MLLPKSSTRKKKGKNNFFRLRIYQVFQRKNEAIYSEEEKELSNFKKCPFLSVPLLFAVILIIARTFNYITCELDDV